MTLETGGVNSGLCRLEGSPINPRTPAVTVHDRHMDGADQTPKLKVQPSKPFFAKFDFCFFFRQKPASSRFWGSEFPEQRIKLGQELKNRLGRF